MTSKLYVGNLPYATTTQELQDLFAPAGSVSAVDLVFDKLTGRSCGFAFVSMATADDAKRAIDQMHGAALGGRNLTVSAARDHDEQPARSFSSEQTSR